MPECGRWAIKKKVVWYLNLPRYQYSGRTITVNLQIWTRERAKTPANKNNTTFPFQPEARETRTIMSIGGDSAPSGSARNSMFIVSMSPSHDLE